MKRYKTGWVYINNTIGKVINFNDNDKVKSVTIAYINSANEDVEEEVTIEKFYNLVEWFPKKGEWCYFYNMPSNVHIARFDKYDSNNFYNKTFSKLGNARSLCIEPLEAIKRNIYMPRAVRTKSAEHYLHRLNQDQ